MPIRLKVSGKMTGKLMELDIIMLSVIKQSWEGKHLFSSLCRFIKKRAEIGILRYSGGQKRKASGGVWATKIHILEGIEHECLYIYNNFIYYNNIWWYIRLSENSTDISSTSRAISQIHTLIVKCI